jgi:hypothetical protein
MAKMPFTWTEEPERKPGPMKVIMQVLLVIVVLTFCAVMIFSHG